MNENCVVCNHEQYINISGSLTQAGDVRICNKCGHIYNSKISSSDELQRFLEKEFVGDPGANKYKSEVKEKNDMNNKNMFIKEMVDIRDNLIKDIGGLKSHRGKEWLEIRPRYFGLADILEKYDIDYEGIDLFEGQIIPYEKIRNKTNITTMKDFFSPIKRKKYDVISNLTVHMLAHTRNPVEFMRDMAKHLKDNGEIIMCEKDVRYIIHKNAPMPLEFPNCLGHMHHMTLEATVNICHVVGLKVISYGYVKRKSALRHFYVKVRKEPNWNEGIKRNPLYLLDSREIYNTIMMTHGW